MVAPGLITSALNGDAGAQRRLYEKLEPVIRQTVRRELRRRGQVRWRSTQTDVDDLVQDMFIHLLSSDAKILREWNPVRGMAFIRLVVERRVITVLRSRRLNPAKLLPVEDDVMALLQGQDPDTEHRVGNSLKVEVMAKRLRERVSERGWRMYQALFIEDLETGEIARRHDMKPNAIFQWRRRLRVQCRQILAELEACG